MSRTNDFRAAIRQAELDRSLDGSWLIFLEIIIAGTAAGFYFRSATIGVGAMITLSVAVAAISASAKATAIALRLVHGFYSIGIFCFVVSAFSPLPGGPAERVGQLIGFAVLSFLLAFVPSFLHDGAFRSQRDFSRE